MKKKLQAALQEVCVIQYSFLVPSTGSHNAAAAVTAARTRLLLFYIIDIYNLHFFSSDSKIRS